MQSLESSLVDVVMGAKSAKEAFKSMARSIVQDLIKIAIQKQITGTIATLVGGLFGGGAAGGAPITASSGAATGGSVQRGVPKLVGSWRRDICTKSVREYYSEQGHSWRRWYNYQSNYSSFNRRTANG